MFNEQNKIMKEVLLEVIELQELEKELIATGDTDRLQEVQDKITRNMKVSEDILKSIYRS